MGSPRRSAAVTLVLASILSLVVRAGSIPIGPITFVVTSAEDSAEVCSLSSVDGTPFEVQTLRCAIKLSNDHAGVIDIIEFDIPSESCPGGICTISVDEATALPEITDSVTIDGRSQPTVNSAMLGFATTVGVDAVALAKIAGPSIEILDGGTHAWGLSVASGTAGVSGIAVGGFGSVASEPNIRAAGGTLNLSDCVIGARATAFTSDASAISATNIRVENDATVKISSCLIGFASSSNVTAFSVAGLTVEKSVIYQGGGTGVWLNGADAENVALTANLIRDNGGFGVYVQSGAEGVVLTNNTIDQSGDPGTTAGVRLTISGNTLDRNRIEGNAGAGVLVNNGSTGNVLTKNRLGGNGLQSFQQIDIDLLGSGDNANVGTSPFVTLNDDGDDDGLTNFPVLLEASLGPIETSADLLVEGYARPGSVIEIFAIVGGDDPTFHGPATTFLLSKVEGSADDLIDSVETYDDPLVGKDETQRFRFIVPKTAAMVRGDHITATATVEGSTSELARNILITQPADVAVEITDSPDPAANGGDVTYTVTFSNEGPNAAPNPKVVLSLGAGASYKSATVFDCGEAPAGTVTCTGDDVAAGASVAFTVTVQSPSNVCGTTFTTSAVASSDLDDPDASDDLKIAGTFMCFADIAVTMIGSLGPVGVGQSLTYVADMYNYTGLAAENVEVTITLPAGNEIISASGPGWSCKPKTLVVTCTRPSFSNADAADDITVVSTAPSSPGEIQAHATVTTTTPQTLTFNDESSVTVNVLPLADVEVSVVRSPDPALVGETITYVATVENNGPAATDATFNVDVGMGPPPADEGIGPILTIDGEGWTCKISEGMGGMGGHGKRPQMGGVPAGWTAFCTRSAFASGSSSSITVTAKAPSTSSSFLVRFRTSGGQLLTVDPVPANNNQDVYTVIAADADLVASLLDAPDPVGAGSGLRYTIGVSNIGVTAAKDVAAVLTLPAGASFVAGSGGGFSCAALAGVVTCTRAELAPADFKSILVDVTAPAQAGTATAMVALDADGTDMNGADNLATATTTVQVTSTSADLAVTAVASPDPAQPGSEITYSVTVTNAGPDAAGGVAATVTLAPGAALATASGTGWSCAAEGSLVSCSLASIANGATSVLTITVTSPSAPGTATTVISVASNAGDAAAGNNSVTVTSTVAPSADLVATLSSSPEPVAPSGALSYLASILNEGPSPASDVVATLTLPTGVTHVETIAAGWSCALAAHVVTCTRATLAASSATTIEVRVTAPASPTSLQASLSVSAATADPVAGNGTAASTSSVETPVGCTVDADCGDATSGRVCAGSACIAGCRGAAPGNGCPAGQMCTSTTAAQGSCVAITVDAGAAAPDAAAPDAAVITPSPDAAVASTPDAAVITPSPDAAVAAASTSSGCGCRAGGGSADGGFLVVLALLFLRASKKRFLQ